MQWRKTVLSNIFTSIDSDHIESERHNRNCLHSSQDRFYRYTSVSNPSVGITSHYYHHPPTDYSYIVILKTIRQLKNAVFWDVTPCSSCKNRRFGKSIASIIRVERISELATTLAVRIKWSNLRIFSQSDVLLSRVVSFYPEAGGYTFLRNGGSHKTYTAPYRRWRLSSLTQQLNVMWAHVIVSIQEITFNINIYHSLHYSQHSLYGGRGNNNFDHRKTLLFLRSN
jgi:hypothetical protein